MCALRNITESFFLCLKSKETYYARCQELDKSKKDGSSAKEIEKVSPSDITGINFCSWSGGSVAKWFRLLVL